MNGGGIVHEQGVPPVPDKQTVTGLPLVRQVLSGCREPDGQKSPAVRQGVSCLPPASGRYAGGSSVSGPLSVRQALPVTPAFLVVDGIQRSPLALHALVGLQLHLRLARFESLLNIAQDEVGEDKGVGTLCPVFRQHTYQKQVHGLGLVPLDGAQQIPPSEREKPPAAAFLQCPAQ